MNWEFGEYAPDRAAIGDHLVDATGVWPAVGGYETAAAGGALAMTALSVQVYGVFSGQSNAGTDTNFCGTAADLFTFTSATSSNVSSSASAYTRVAGFWEFARFNNAVLAVNGWAATASGGTGVQAFDMDSSTAFATVAGAPHAAHIATVGDFVVLGNTYDVADGHVARRVRWCGIGDQTSWTVSATTQADYNDLPQGTVQAIRGGEYGVVITERSVWRMAYVGSPLVFQFDETIPGIGTRNPASVVRVGELTFMYATDGFRVIEAGQSSKPIGKGRVDIAAAALLTGAGDTTVVGAHIPRTTRIVWMVGAGAFLYDWALDRWSRMSAVSTQNFGGTEYFGHARSLLSSGSEELAHFKFAGAKGTGYVFGPYTGAVRQPITIQTAFRELTPGRRTRVNRLTPILDGAAALGVDVDIFMRNDLNIVSGAQTEATDTAHTGTGTYTCRAEARYHAVGYEIGAGTTQMHKCVGVTIDEAEPMGFR